jgi:hypothetical protein
MPLRVVLGVLRVPGRLLAAVVGERRRREESATREDDATNCDPLLHVILQFD